MKFAMMVLALIAAAVASAASAAPGEVPGRLGGSPSPTDVAVAGEVSDALAKKLSAALPPTVTLVDTRSAFDQHKTPRWIAGLRFSQPGSYTIKHSCTLTPQRAGGEAQVLQATYEVRIAPRGAPRVHLRGVYPDNISPTACLGDIVELPIGVYKAATGHAFEVRHRPATAASETPYGELGDIKYLRKHVGKAITAEGRMTHLELLAAGAAGASSRLIGPGSFTNYSLSGLFKCTKEGRFALRSAITVDGKRQEQSLPVVIAPAGQSIRVLVSRIEQTRQSGEFKSSSTQRLAPGPVVARVGDYLSAYFGGHRVSGERSDDVRQPTVSLREGEFGNNAWPLKGGPADPSRAAEVTRELAARLAAAERKNESLASRLAAKDSQIAAFERTYAEQVKMTALLTEHVAARNKENMAMKEQLQLQQRTLRERERELERTVAQLRATAEQLVEARATIEKLVKENAQLRGGAAGTGSPAKPKPAKPIMGRVTAVDVEHNVAQLNVGSAAGVTKNMRFILYRGASFVGYFVVSEVESAICAGVLKDLQMPPRAGDRATTRLSME